MDLGMRTPLLDAFRRGDVPREARVAAADGSLAPRAHEQLALLMLLSTDSDAEVAGIADRTLASIPQGRLAGFLARSDVGPEMRAFFAARGIEPADVPDGDPDVPLVEVAAAGVDEAGEATPEDEQSTLQRLATLGIAQRIGVAMKGTREERAILIRDPNRIVASAVLSSPKVTETEIEIFARMGSVSEDTLRIIGGSRAWTKRYGVVVALVKNPKTPVAMSMNLMPRLGDKELKALSTDRNIPDALRMAARRRSARD